MLLVMQLYNVSLFCKIMLDSNSYLHFCQGLKTLEQIFGQGIQIIVGQTPRKERKKQLSCDN